MQICVLMLYCSNFSLCVGISGRKGIKIDVRTQQKNLLVLHFKGFFSGQLRQGILLISS